MEIIHLQDGDGGDYAWFAEGHHDLAAFCRELAKQFPDAPDAEAAPPLHTYLRMTGERNGDGLDTEEFCGADAENAHPVTVMAAADYWDDAAVHAV